MSSLPIPLRRQLESAIKQARSIAAGGAGHALEALAVHEPDPYRHMDEAQRALRKKLRAQAKQLGDGESLTKRGAYEIKHLAEKLAYDQWHRLLFARYLLENNLLISPEHGVAVSLDDCEELAPAEGLKDAWAVAARFAAKELPEIFRADDPAGAVELSVNDRHPLIALVTGLPVEVFTASDSLGWCYQFWQAEKKDEVNAAGNKIGADELPAVTQLFTEDYMVDFLLDNTLGAWHAGKVLATNPTLAETAQSEEELRNAVALPGCPWKYLRFIRTHTPSPLGGEGRGEGEAWTPAAGTFDGWPKIAQELKCLDPCMGSGHFIVALFERLVALRLAEESLDLATAVAAVIRDNLFGLEIDPRCTQISAFNLALAAWRRVGHCTLPPMTLACSGLAPNAKKEDWLELAGDNDRLQRGMERLYALFKDAPVLGSLINPRLSAGDMYVADYHELQPLLEQALAPESKDDTAHEMAVTARGLAKAAEILSGQFTLVATNVPYLGRGNQVAALMDYCTTCYSDSQADLAACFVERCQVFCGSGSSTALVIPQSWLSQGRYESVRRRILQSEECNLLAKLGTRAFETIGGEIVNVAFVVFSEDVPPDDFQMSGIDVSVCASPTEKAEALCDARVTQVFQSNIYNSPKSKIALVTFDKHDSLDVYSSALHGQAVGDNPSYNCSFWEVESLNSGWDAYQCQPDVTCLYGGRHSVIHWENETGRMAELAASVRHLNHKAQQWRSGKPNWGKRGVAISLVGRIYGTLYSGDIYAQSCCVIVPHDMDHLLAIWAFAESGALESELRLVDSSLGVSVKTVISVPFDLKHWQKVAAEKYPRGLPKPFSSDPTQWLFNGHPAGADHPLHAAVARLLGYQWPRQTGSSFPDCPALGPDGLEKLADVDGIVPISPIKGEGPAAERLRELLASTYGKDWNATRQEALLAQVDYAGASLEDWLRNGFFEQHCALFHHRPFIWHVWDGLKSGFSALVNYHKLTHANLEKLTFAYLGDWIRRQQAAVDAGEAGSDARLQAAKNLQDRLKLILEGEPPYDIFVRWKPLSKQAVCWHPDLNDGVRMNIRPFLALDIPGGKKGAGILRTKPNIKWEKDRGKEPVRDKAEFPWFWGWDEKTQDFAGVGKEPDGNRWNDCHYSNTVKQAARAARK